MAYFSAGCLERPDWPWYEYKSNFFKFFFIPVTICLLNIMKYMVMKGWVDNIMTQFFCQNLGGNSISSQHYSSSFKLPSTKWKKKLFLLVCHFMVGKVAGTRLIIFLRVTYFHTLKIYIIHWHSRGSLYRYTLVRCMGFQSVEFHLFSCL